MRPLTRLCEKNKQAFRDDFRDYGNAEGRDIAMLGLQPDSRGLVKSEAHLKKALHRFATEGARPVQAVYGREDDGDEVIYANWPFSEPVRSLIAFWLVRPDNIDDLHWASWSESQTQCLEGAIAQILDGTAH